MPLADLRICRLGLVDTAKVRPAQQPETNPIYCETQCKNVTSGLDTGIRAFSPANDNATILHPAYYGKQNQRF